jgi:circadian clock protein KaiC
MVKKKSTKKDTSKKKLKNSVEKKKVSPKKSIAPIKKASKKISEKDKKIISKSKKPEKKEFLRTGIPGFDSLFPRQGGIPSGAAVLIEGGPGSGKTIFCLHTMHNLCKQGKKCLYMSFEEPEEKLIEHMENFGWPAGEYVKKGLLKVRRFDAIDVSRSIEALLSAAKKELLIEVNPVFFPTDFDPEFVTIDSLTSIASAFSGEDNRFRIYMEQLFRYLENRKITNFLIREVSSPSHVGGNFQEEGAAVSFLSDGIVVIYNVIYDTGKRGAAIEVLKMRGVEFEKKMVEFKIIDKKGMVITPNKVLKKTGKASFSLT